MLDPPFCFALLEHEKGKASNCWANPFFKALSHPRLISSCVSSLFAANSRESEFKVHPLAIWPSQAAWPNKWLSLWDCGYKDLLGRQECGQVNIEPFQLMPREKGEKKPFCAREIHRAMANLFANALARTHTTNVSRERHWEIEWKEWCRKKIFA